MWKNGRSSVSLLLVNISHPCVSTRWQTVLVHTYLDCCWYLIIIGEICRSDMKHILLHFLRIFTRAFFLKWLLNKSQNKLICKYWIRLFSEPVYLCLHFVQIFKKPVANILKLANTRGPKEYLNNCQLSCMKNRMLLHSLEEIWKDLTK